MGPTNRKVLLAGSITLALTYPNSIARGTPIRFVPIKTEKGDKTYNETSTPHPLLFYILPGTHCYSRTSRIVLCWR